MVARNTLSIDRFADVTYITTEEIYNDLEPMFIDKSFVVVHGSIKRTIAHKAFDLLFNSRCYSTSFSKKMIIDEFYPVGYRHLVSILQYVAPKVAQLIFFSRILKSLTLSNGLFLEGDSCVLTSPSSDLDRYVYLGAAKGVYFENEIFSWDNITSRGFIHSALERFNVWNRYVSSSLTEFYDTDKGLITISGVPFAEFALSAVRKEKILCSQKRILYTTGESEFLSFEPSLVRGLIDALSDLSIIWTIRLHPLDNCNLYSWIENYNNVYLEEPGTKTSSGEYFMDTISYRNYFSSLSNFDLVLNIASTTTLDCVLIGQNVANINFLFEDTVNPDLKNINSNYKTDHFKKVVEYNVVPNLMTLEDLRNIILTSKDYRIQETKNYDSFLRDFFGLDR